jgi:hypothetical protein
VPKEYQRYLLKEPVTAEIIAVGKTVAGSSKYLEEQETAVTINAGKAAGLLPGMILHPTYSDNQDSSATVKITKVEADKGEGVLSQSGPSYSAPKVGWKLSTWAWWHTEEGS